MVADKLTVILVRSHHIHVQFRPSEFLRYRAYHIVRLESGFHQHAQSQCFAYADEGLERVNHQLRSLGTVGLVFGVHLVAEGSSRRVEGHRDMGRFLPVNEF